MKRFFGWLALIAVSLVFLGTSKGYAQGTFSDLSDNHWAARAVYELVRAGVISGFPDGTFRGTSNVNRYEVAVILSKFGRMVRQQSGAGLSEKEVQAIVDKRLAATSSPAKAGGTSVSGVIFTHYEKGLSNSTTINKFDVTRTYINFKNAVDNKTSVRVTLDAKRASGLSNQNQFAFVKYAYGEMKDFLPGDWGMPLSMNLRLGLQPTYWAGFMDEFLGIRYITKSLVDVNGVQSTALLSG